MEPKYFAENRYSFVVDQLPRGDKAHYEVETAETSFERYLRRQLAGANRLLMTGRYSAALADYRHIRGLIAAAMRPQISVANGGLVDHGKVQLDKLADSLVAVSAEMLSKTPVSGSTIAERFRSSEVSLPDEVIDSLAPFEALGIRDQEAALGGKLDQASVLVRDGEFAKAASILESAMGQTQDAPLRGALRHDLAILQERDGKRAQALKTMEESVRSLEQIKEHELQLTALTSLAGMQLRGEDTDKATQTVKTISAVQKKNNVFSIFGTATIAEASFQPMAERLSTVGNLGTFASPLRSTPTFASGTFQPVAGPNVPTPGAASSDFRGIQAQPVQLLAKSTFEKRRTPKEMTIVDSALKSHRIRLDKNASRDLGRFYATLQKTNDIGLLMGYLQVPTVTVAYLTHVYSWVIPMAVGDCLAALGSYEEAEREYLSTLNYPFLNEVVETVNLWLRLADLYLEWGDRLYRQARNDVSEFGKAREKYEKVLRLDNTIDDDSPLYKSPKFVKMRTRVGNAIQRLFVNRVRSADNPRVLMALMRARHQIFKIDNKLNFIGLGVHIPPFSFEHLQNLARYFAQHASQVEQMYIQFKSTGENEELREEQMAQQGELAAASVELENRGLDEAREGVDVANANLNYTNVQVENATELRNQFDAVDAELQEIARLQAWAGAASNDEVNLNVKHATYYSASGKPRSHVLFDLANRRAQISNAIESTRLQNEVEAASAYRGVAQQQVEQSEARVEVAEQRVAIAELQEQHANENLSFLTGREFSSAMWYNLAREARRLTQRYLDMAIEVATLMEKAYEAETGRDLRKIKFEYGLERINGLLGADALLLDVDYFSLDHVRTKSKKAPLKQVISMADQFPLAFNRLLRTGRTFFETTLEHFDRRYPGFYLQKVKQVEMVFVGLNGTEGVHGTVRNIGLSQFRRKSGEIVRQTYPADVMPLSEYDVKQDAIVFQLDSKELRLFENNGIATMWQLDLPLANNTFDLNQILDIQLVLYYDGFFDAGLERRIKAALPTSGQGARAMGLQLYAPDELFFLKSQGSAVLKITPELFPFNQVNQVLKRYRIQAVGAAAAVSGLRLRVDFADLGASHTFRLDNHGNADGAAFAGPLNRSLFDTWTLTIDPTENPGVDLAALNDLAVYLEYDFDYRS